MNERLRQYLLSKVKHKEKEVVKKEVVKSKKKRKIEDMTLVTMRDEITEIKDKQRELASLLTRVSWLMGTVQWMLKDWCALFKIDSSKAEKFIRRYKDGV